MKNPVVEFAQAVLDAAELVKRSEDLARAGAEAEAYVSKLRADAEAVKAQCAAQLVDANQKANASVEDAHRYVSGLKRQAGDVAKKMHDEAAETIAKARGEVRFLEGVKDKLASECANLSGAVSELTTQKTDLESAIARLKDSIAKV